MSDAMLAVMRGPDRDVFQANVPRLNVREEAGEGSITVRSLGTVGSSKRRSVAPNSESSNVTVLYPRILERADSL